MIGWTAKTFGMRSGDNTENSGERMGTVIENAARASAWIATALSSSGYIVSFRGPGLTNLSSYQSRPPKGHDDPAGKQLAVFLKSLGVGQ
jgi:hypothetical protein